MRGVRPRSEDPDTAGGIGVSGRASRCMYPAPFPRFPSGRCLGGLNAASAPGKDSRDQVPADSGRGRLVVCEKDIPIPKLSMLGD